MKTLVVLSLLLCLASVKAQPAVASDDLPARIAEAREHLQQERQAIESLHEERARACWQRFAVNDCLREVRRSRHDALDPLRPRELELNAQERDWRSRQRDDRLRYKQEAAQIP